MSVLCLIEMEQDQKGEELELGEVVEIVQILQYHQEEVQEEDLENNTLID